MKRTNPFLAEEDLPQSDAAESPATSFQAVLETAGDAWGLASYLDTQSIGRFQQANRFCLAFTSNPYDWRLRLVREFGFKMETLTNFEEGARSLGINIHYQDIYKHVRQLYRNKKILTHRNFIPHALDKQDESVEALSKIIDTFQINECHRIAPGQLRV